MARSINVVKSCSPCTPRGYTVLFATHDVVTTGEKRRCYPRYINSFAHAQWLALAARSARSAAAAAAAIGRVNRFILVI